MLPPSKSEFDQDEHGADDDLEAQMRASSADVAAPDDDENQDLPTAEDGDVDLESDEGDEDLGQEEEPKPKKKGLGKGTIIAAVGAGLLVTLCGAAYMMQGQLQTAAPAKQVAIDPSLLASKPESTPSVVTPPQGAAQEMTPNLNGAPTPVVTTPSSISAPPSDPFASSASPAASVATPVVAPVEPVAPVVTTPVVTAPVVAITPAPVTTGSDPFGAVTTEKPPAIKAEKPAVVEPVEIKPAKPVKEVKAKPAPVVLDSDEVAVTKPKPVAKPRVKKPAVVRQDMSVSEGHPSQERVQPQSSESFNGYEKLF